MVISVENMDSNGNFIKFIIGIAIMWTGEFIASGELLESIDWFIRWFVGIITVLAGAIVTIAKAFDIVMGVWEKWGDTICKPLNKVKEKYQAVKGKFRKNK